jgi:hypothetical protein
MTKETYASLTAVLKKAVCNASATLLLERIVFWNTRKKGGVTYEGRLWSYRSQKEWIELAGLKERTGKTVFKLLGACPSSGGIFGTNLIPLRHEQTFSSLDN